MIRRVLVTACAGLWLPAAACRHQAAAVAPAGPATLYAEAMRLFRAGRFVKSQAGFQKLQFDLSPRDSLQADVRFFLAESYVGQGEYVTAAREFRRVADDYPAHALAPSALLRLGDCHAALWRRSELDPTSGETALAAYQELVSRYPESPAARVAALRIGAIQEMFARKDYDNGVFYFKRGGFDSAILYFRNLIVKYPSSTLVADAYVKLVQAYRAINYREEREEVCAHLRQYFGGRADVRRECGDGSPGR